MAASKNTIPIDTVSEIVRAASSAVLLPNIPHFTGEVSSTEAKQWLNSIENQATIAGWNNIQKLEAAKRLLLKAAKTWYLLSADDIKTWYDFRQQFSETFIGSETNVVDKWERFSLRAQNENESPIEYIFDKLRLAKDVGASVTDSKNAVCSGFKNEEMANFLRVYDYSKAADWTRRLREFQSSKPSLNRPSSPSDSSSDNDSNSEEKSSGCLSNVSESGPFQRGKSCVEDDTPERMADCGK
ncbi:unnamed protein product [Allacma fusca]|uniref:Retrotransposon gag domain-containing protein n=1 Tax=Allacma fusca TaxID=39272 RepID=A0A8J2L7M0_9HEXA|nr:unnamed protein product [Allacma fusca]